MNTDLNGKIQGKLNQNRKNRNTKKVLLVLSLAAVILTSTVLANPASALTEDVSGEVVQGLENGGDSGSGAQAPAQAAVEQADAQGNEAASSSDPQETLAAPSADQGVMNANSVSAVDSAAVTENGTGDSGIAVSGAEADGTKKSADQISAAEGSGTAEQGATLAEAAETVSTEEAAADKTTEKTEQAAQSETDVLSFADDRAQMKIARKDGTGFPSDTTMSGSPLGTDDWNRVLSAVSAKVKAQSDDSTAYSVTGLHTWTLSLQAGDGSAASYDDIRAEAEFQGGLNDAGYATKTSEKEESGTDGTSTTTTNYETSWRVYAISGDSIADPVEDHLTDLTDADGTSLSVDENGALQSAAFDGSLPETVVFAQLVRETVTTGTEKKEEIPMPAVTFDKEAATDHGTITVHVEADEGTFEQGTTMSVKQVSSQDILDKAIEAAGGRGSAAAVDISFRKADGTETEPAKPIRVKMTAKVLGQADKAHVVHVDDNGSTVVVAKKSDGKTIESTSSEAALSDAKNAVSFESDSFSVYAIVYTVDFHYENDGENEPKISHFSIEGGTSVTLRELIEVLGIIGDTNYENIEAFLADVDDVTFSDESLVEVVHPAEDTTVAQAVEELGVEQVFSVWLDEDEKELVLRESIPAGEWVLISLLPFDTEERLTITMNDGDKYIIKVTDDAIAQQSGSDNLSSFLWTVSVSNVEDGGTVKVGRTYSMHFTFGEMDDSQLSTTSALTYKIPDGIKMVQPSGTFNVTYAGTTYSGNTFTYDESTNTITVNFSDTVKALVAKSPDAQFTIDINGQFTGEKTHFDFSEAISKDYVIDNDHDTSVNKSGSYHSDDNKVHYTVTASSSGKSDHVVITDTVTGTALNYDRGSIQVSGNSAPYTIEESDNGFIVRLDSMNDQETVTVTYTASVDFDNVTGKGTVTQTGNTVEIKADGDPGETKPTDVSNQIDYNPLGKNAGAASGSGNTKTIPWTITVNEQQLKSVAGLTITDHNNSADVMSYSGSGISIAVMDGSRTIRTITKTWAELGIDDPSAAATWSYKLPETDDDLNNTYKYVITYETTVDASGKITDFNVNNGVSDDEGHTGGGGTTVPPGDDKVTLEKKTASFSAATSEWEISFNVPKDGFSSAVVTDYFPSKWASSHWIDALTGEIVIEGLFDEESYTIDTSDESKVVITFYKSGEKTDANRGLREGDSERTVTIKLATENTSEWVQEYSGDNHTNTASLDVNGQVVTDTAVSNPKSEGVAKTGNYEGTIIINGREYPVFKYTLNLYGVSDASFDNNGKLTLTDEYNGEYLKLLVKSTDEDWGELRWSWANKNNAYQGGRTTWTDINGLLTITADKNEFVLDGNGLYSPVYQIYYYLIVKDETTLDTLERVSINAADHKVPIENTVTWGDFHDEVTIDYEYPGVDKEQLGHADSKGMVKYKIVLNPDKQTLNNGEPMEMQDSATNITVDYSTIQIETDPAADITYYYRGYTGYYTIPDRTKVTITYSARVIGDGEVPISNDAVMKGFKDSTSATETGDSSGSGNLNIDWVVVYKHEWRKMDKGLNDAVYVLTDEDGNPILYPTTAKNGLVGQPVTFTTGNIDLNALPDGTRLAEETNYRDGYAWLYLDKDQTGLAFQKGITYYFKEYEAPPGYQKDDTIFTFTISEHPDYDDWEYHKGDILRLADSKVEGNLEISKTFVGAENLTDTQKQQITFKITAVDNTGAPMKIPYTKDTDGNNVYSDETGLEITYADFENGVYKLEALPDGIYTVIETNAELGGYTHTSTTYLVDGETGNEDDYSGTITISDSTKHTVAYTNNYEPEDAHITVLKKDDSGQISLYGATFQLYKKNSGGTYEVVTDHDGLTSNGEFTIDYDNRENGVTITKLVPGDYYIKETKAPADYQLDETPFYFTVHEHNEKVTGGTHGANVTFENAPNGKDLVATVTDKISHTYTLTKVDALKLSKKLNGAKFTVAELTGFNSEGAVVTSDTNYWTFTTGEDGTIVIDADALGLLTNKVYVIWETKAPEGYEQSNKIYAFYTGEQSAVSTQLIQLRSGYPDASIVSLANGPQKTSVPNTENSMDLYAYKQWYKVDGTKDKDLVSWITEIEVQLFRVVTDSNGDVVEDSPYPDADTTYLLKKGAGGNSSFLDYKWEGLPTGDSVNTANPLTYTYYVKEVVPEGYEARYVLGTGSGNSLTDSSVHADASDVAVGADSSVKTVQIRNSPKVLNLQMEKVWLDDGNHWNNNSVTFHIRYTDNTHTLENPGTPNDADLGGSYKVDPNLPGDSNVTGNRWAYNWPTLAPWTDNDPSNPRTYFVLEDNGHIASMKSAGYGDPSYSTVETEDGEKTVITNTKTSSDKLQVKKVWLNADGTELKTSPDTSVTVQLQRIKGKLEGTTVYVDPWKNSYIAIKNGTTITFRYSISKTGDNYGAERPSQIDVPALDPNEVNLAINGSSVAMTPTADDKGITGQAYGWHHTIIYTFEYTFTPSQSDVISFNGNSAGQYLEYTVPTITTPEGAKMEDVSNEDISDARVTLSVSNGWIKTWNNLPTDAGDGYSWLYSVREVDVPAGFDVSYENNDGIQTGIMYVKNTKSEYTRATASKKWLDADGNEIAAPSGAEVVFTLYQDGRKTNQTVTLDGTVDEDGETDAWIATFEGLEMYKADGTTPHEYTVKELTGYTGYTAVSKNTVTNEWESAETSNTVASGGTIYNKKVRQIQVTKKWVDQSGTELVESPNGSVKIDLYKNADLHTIIASVTLDGRIDPHGEETAWVATFSNLDDNTIYVVKEGACSLSNFTLDVISPNESAASGDGSFTVTNKQSQQTSIDLNIVKVDATDMTTPLAKAQFTLRKLDPAGKGTYLSGDAEVTKTSGLTNTDGEASITEIEDGYYEISETKTPDGYVLIDSGKFYIHVDGGDISLLIPDSSKVVTDWEIRTITSEDKLEFNATTKTAKVGNTPGAALPHTGGPGTRLFTILGSILILGAGVLLWRRRRLI